MIKTIDMLPLLKLKDDFGRISLIITPECDRYNYFINITIYDSWSDEIYYKMGQPGGVRKVEISFKSYFEDYKKSGSCNTSNIKEELIRIVKGISVL